MGVTRSAWINATWRGVVAGESVVYISDPGTFDTITGWIVAGEDQYLYGTWDDAYGTYTDIVLKTIPTSGAGAIVETLTYGDRVLSPPQLLLGALAGCKAASGTLLTDHPDDERVTAVSVSSTAEPVNTLESVTTVSGREAYLSDSSLTHAAAQDRAQAEADLYGDPIDSLRYETRDPAIRPGALITVNFAPGGLNANANGTYIVRRITMTDPGDQERHEPWRAVEASTADSRNLIAILRRLEARSGSRVQSP